MGEDKGACFAGVAGFWRGGTMITRKCFKILVALSFFTGSFAGVGPACAGQKAADAGKPVEETELTIKKPDSEEIVAYLTMPLRFSSKQENRIKAALKNIEKKFGKLSREHALAVTEAKKWRFKISDLRYEMNKLNKTIPDTIRPLLDSEQREKFDQMLAQGQKKKVLKKASAGAGKPIRKKRERIRKKKLAAAKQPEPQSKPAPALPGLEPLEEASPAGEEEEIPFGAYP